MKKMVDWTLKNVPPSLNPSILEVGSGNGSLLFALLKVGYTPTRICGVDYSEDAVKLATAIGSSKGEDASKIKFGVCDFLKDFPQALTAEEGGAGSGVWDLILDKGTFDAMALAEKEEGGRHPADVYPSRIAQILKPGGYFLIVCELTWFSFRVFGRNVEPLP